VINYFRHPQKLANFSPLHNRCFAIVFAQQTFRKREWIMLDFLQGLLAIRDVDQIGILLVLLLGEVALTWVLGRKFYEASDSFCSVAMGLF